MCGAMAVMSAAAVASAVASGYSQYQQGQSQKKWGDYQANQAQADANAERSLAEVEAGRIREAARKQRGGAKAALAASGIDVNEGISSKIDKEIVAGGEHDAMLAIFGGVDAQKRGYAQASALRSQGRQAATAGRIGLGTSLLGAASSGYSSYKSGWFANGKN